MRIAFVRAVQDLRDPLADLLECDRRRQRGTREALAVGAIHSFVALVIHSANPCNSMTYIAA